MSENDSPQDKTQVGPAGRSSGGAGLAQARQPQHKAHRKAGMQSSFANISFLPSQCRSPAVGCALMWFLLASFSLQSPLQGACVWRVSMLHVLLFSLVSCPAAGDPKSCTMAQAEIPAIQTSGATPTGLRTPNTDYAAVGTC